ncbi:unnamed protein product [Schistosoma margrebowiei]|uniref:Uncharacterized protein n=1 Tax=Schistosoma margrebowiei TaxID=48269 RepID=A0A183MN66_9TREM|nr:unnamed protein product [Schistosoma margrebowiei]
MWETWKTSQIATGMKRYNLAVLGISETHWTQAEQQRLNTGEMLLYSGHEEENAQHTQEVALMLSKVARNALVGWESHGSRIIKASFKTMEGITMNIIQCYAPTNDSNDDIKDQFYERLQSVIEKCPRKDLTILMGDLNTKVGIDNTGYEDIMGQHELGEKNGNGERFANLCAFNKLVMGGTIFPHKCIHKATWISPDHTTENQIDHICINKKFQRTMEDVRTRRGADVASDHHRVDLLKEEETTTEDNWEGIKEASTSTCQEVLDLKKHHHKEWISIETLDMIEEKKKEKTTINNSQTRAEKVQAQAEYIEANKQVKKSIRADKREYVEELATTAEKAAREGNMRQLYDTTKKLAEKYSKPERPVKDKEGRKITEIQQQRNR